MLLDFITLLITNRRYEKEIREIVSIAGVPFYRSLDVNSRYGNTWLPFAGISLGKTTFSLTEKGWFNRFTFSVIPKDVNKQYEETFRTHKLNQYSSAHYEMMELWHSVPHVILSSHLGGGLWESNEGKQFKAYLQENYAAVYALLPTIEFNEQCSVDTQIGPFEKQFSVYGNESLNNDILNAIDVEIAATIEKYMNINEMFIAQAAQHRRLVKPDPLIMTELSIKDKNESHLSYKEKNPVIIKPEDNSRVLKNLTFTMTDLAAFLEQHTASNNVTHIAQKDDVSIADCLQQLHASVNVNCEPTLRLSSR